MAGIEMHIADLDLAGTCEACATANEVNVALRQIAFVDSVEALDVGVPGTLEGGPIVRTDGQIKTVMAGIMRCLCDLRGVPHHLFRHATHVHAGATES